MAVCRDDWLMTSDLGKWMAFCAAAGEIDESVTRTMKAARLVTESSSKRSGVSLLAYDIGGKRIYGKIIDEVPGKRLA